MRDLPRAVTGLTVAWAMVGETHYIVPWGLSYDLRGHAWLNPYKLIHPVPEGTVSMRIHRMSGFFVVWPPSGHKRQLTATAFDDHGWLPAYVWGLPRYL